MRFVALPKRRFVVLSLLAGLAIAFAVSYATRDVTPPQVYAEVPERAPAGLPLELLLSADEPATFDIRYAGQRLREVTQTLRLSLEVEPGPQSLDVVASDSAQNSSSYRYELYGVPLLEPSLELPGRLRPGAPFSLRLGWPPDGPRPASLRVAVNGETRRVFSTDDGAVALAAVPLGTPEGRWPVEVSFTDDYGRSGGLTRSLEIAPGPEEVEDLDLSSSVLSVVTPEGEVLEQQTMARAYARSDEVPQPLWLEPFVLPIEGRTTSGFGSPRRYAAGGDLSYHYGADIAAPEGTPVRATNRGRVLVAGFFPIKGGFVALDHGAGVYSLYFHQSTLAVEVGQEVARGEVIGEVGTTGLSTGPHLHWEMRVFGEASDPLAWVGKLLP